MNGTCDPPACHQPPRQSFLFQEQPTRDSGFLMNSPAVSKHWSASMHSPENAIQNGPIKPSIQSAPVKFIHYKRDPVEVCRPLNTHFTTPRQGHARRSLQAHLHASKEDQHFNRHARSTIRYHGGGQRVMARVSHESPSGTYIDLEQTAMQTIGNPFGTRL